MGAILQERWYSPAELAALIGQSKATLARWRCQRRGPAFLKLGGHSIAYISSDVEKWLQSLRREGEEKNATQSTARPMALPFQNPGKDVQRVHRFGGHRTKAERG